MPLAKWKDLCWSFSFFLALFAQEGLGEMEGSSLLGLAKASLGTWERVCLLLQTTLLTSSWIRCAVTRQRVCFCNEGRSRLSFPWGAHATSSSWDKGARQASQSSQAGSTVSSSSLLQLEVNPEGWEAYPWGQNSGLFIFGSLLELRLVFKNKSRKLGFQFLEKSSLLLEVYQMVLQLPLSGRANYVLGEEIRVTG